MALRQLSLAPTPLDRFFSTFMNYVVSQSPYASSSSALQPKQIARLRDTTGNGGHFMAANANTVLAIIDATTLQVTRLKSREFPCASTWVGRMTPPEWW